jgi:hypothetical protein
LENFRLLERNLVAGGCPNDGRSGGCAPEEAHCLNKLENLDYNRTAHDVIGLLAIEADMNERPVRPVNAES